MPVLGTRASTRACKPCKEYTREVFPTDAFKEKAKAFVLVHVDIDKQAAVASKYNVSSIPDIRFLDSSGKRVGQIGYQEGGPGPFVDALSKM